MTRAADLYQLQCLDHELDATRNRLAQVEAALGESEALKQARQVLQNAQATVQRWTVQQRDLELEIQGLSDKVSHSEEQLYGGAVRNPKELTDLQHEVASLRRRRQKLEDTLLEAMIELDEARDAHATAHEVLEKVEMDWSTHQAGLRAEREALQARRVEVEQARAELLPRIGARDQAIYQNLRSRKGGLAVVQVRDGACGGCGITVPPSLDWQLRQEGVGTCGNCERIIVRL